MSKKKAVKKKAAKKPATKYTEKIKINASFNQVLAMTFNEPSK